MIGVKYSQKEREFLKKNLKKLRKYLEKKKPKNNKKENKYIDNFLSYKISTKDSDKINRLRLLKKEHLKESLYFSITELGESNKDFYKADNLFEYTKKNWLFQKEAFEEDSIKSVKWKIKRDYPEISEDSEEFETLKDKEVERIKTNTIERFGEEYDTFYSYGSWCRWIEDDKIKYGVIESVENYFVDKVSSIVSKKVKEYIPSCITNYPDKQFLPTENGMSTWNMETKADGREEELKRLEKKMNEFQVQFVKENLPELLKGLEGKIFKKDICIRRNCSTHIYIPDTYTAKLLSTENFLVDCYKLEQPFGIVKAKVKKIFKESKIYEDMEEIYKMNLIEELQDKLILED